MSRKFSGLYFPAFGLNTGKYGPEKTPYLDTFNAVTKTLWCFNFLCFIITFVSELNGTANFIQKPKINERLLLAVILPYIYIYIYHLFTFFLLLLRSWQTYLSGIISVPFSSISSFLFYSFPTFFHHTLYSWTSQFKSIFAFSRSQFIPFSKDFSLFLPFGFYKYFVCSLKCFYVPYKWISLSHFSWIHSCFLILAILTNNH